MLQSKESNWALALAFVFLPWMGEQVLGRLWEVAGEWCCWSVEEAARRSLRKQGQLIFSCNSYKIIGMDLIRYK